MEDNVHTRVLKAQLKEAMQHYKNVETMRADMTSLIARVCKSIDEAHQTTRTIKTCMQLLLIVTLPAMGLASLAALLVFASWLTSV